jgi:O-antigen biosynthesis protein
MLVIDSMIPDPTRDSGSVRLLHMLDILRELEWDIYFLPDDGIAAQAGVEALARVGAHNVVGDLRRWLIGNGEYLQAVLLSRLAVATQHLDLIRRYAPNARVVFDTVDLHYIREGRAADLSGRSSMRRLAKRSRRLEHDAISRCDFTLVVSEEERRILATDLPGAHVEVVSNIHEPVGRMLDLDDRSGLLFVGGFGHPPNAEAMQWFVREIFPHVHSIEPSITLHVVGDIDPLSRAALSVEGVTIHGRVADLGPLIEASRVSIAPLRFGAGVKGKVNQAMAHGLPVVVTSIAAEGMHLVDGVDALIADTPEAFAHAILKLCRDDELWHRLSDAGPANIRTYFSRQTAKAVLARVFHQARIPARPS